jgi:glutaryl-CoA dehydrogenase (non-decarboxylating)
MDLELLDPQHARRLETRSFVEREISPYAEQFDQQERIPVELIRKMARRGYLGASLPREWGGRGTDLMSYGVVHEEIGRGCSSVRSLLTVQDMVALAVFKWGSKEQKERWVPRFAGGESIAAFALSEPGVGSDAKAVTTAARASRASYILTGHKRWISFGQLADVFLVIAHCEGSPAAFLVERQTPHLALEPITGMLGLRGSMLAAVSFDRCEVPRENLVGRVGFGFSHVASTSLDHGRYSVAWGCVGVAQACLQASIRYAREREQFGDRLENYQLVQRMIADMATNIKAARLLCLRAGQLRQERDPAAVLETSIAKYFASTSLMGIATDAVQIHGANGCSNAYPVQRYMRDAKIMEIIEGSTQIQQINIARHAAYDVGAQALAPDANWTKGVQHG